MNDFDLVLKRKKSSCMQVFDVGCDFSLKTQVDRVDARWEKPHVFTQEPSGCSLKTCVCVSVAPTRVVSAVSSPRGRWMDEALQLAPGLVRWCYKSVNQSALALGEEIKVCWGFLGFLQVSRNLIPSSYFALMWKHKSTDLRFNLLDVLHWLQPNDV